MRRFEKELLQFVETSYGGVLKDIADEKSPRRRHQGEIKTALDAFKDRFTATIAAAAALSRRLLTKFHAYLTRFPAPHSLGKEHAADHACDEVRVGGALRRAQEAAMAARPYAKELVRVLRSTMARIESPQHPLLAKRPEERILFWFLPGNAVWPAHSTPTFCKEPTNFSRASKGKRSY